MLNFHSFKAFGSTHCRLHQRLQKSFKAAASSTRYLLKSMRDGNLYFGPLEIIEWILESVSLSLSLSLSKIVLICFDNVRQIEF